jgi:D-alanyl-D-alanine endopeptidase (penicillin-binding protein 7)
VKALREINRLTRLWRAGAGLALGCVLVLSLSASAWANREAALSKPGARGEASAAKPGSPSKARRAAAPARQARPVRAAQRQAVPRRPSAGQRAGLHETDDPLSLKSSVALVIDQDTQQVLFSKNPEAVLPIASITKLMTALVVVEAGLSLDERLSITQEDVDVFKGTGSRLRVGTALTRGELLHLALMASENRAAHALGRTYPGGLVAFREAMNAKASLLGMHHTQFVEPTGLSSDNRSSASDLAVLVREASRHPLIGDLSTTPDLQMALGARQVAFRNTNGLVRNPAWEIALQKTGYISEAGRCVVMKAQTAGRNLIMVLLDSAGRHARIGDAERLRAWLSHAVPPAGASPSEGKL